MGEGLIGPCIFRTLLNARGSGLMQDWKLVRVPSVPYSGPGSVGAPATPRPAASPAREVRGRCRSTPSWGIALRHRLMPGVQTRHRIDVTKPLYDLSDRELCDEGATHASLRWACRLNFHHPVTHHAEVVACSRSGSTLWCGHATGNDPSPLCGDVRHRRGRICRLLPSGEGHTG